MNPTLRQAARHFPLLGRPRPSCPALTDRLAALDTMLHETGDDLADGAHTLNMAALIASDCRMPDLAADLCWQHINTYRAAPGPLSVHQARYLLEPVLNLARLQIRAQQGQPALDLLAAMYGAVTAGTDLLIDGRLLSLAYLTGTPAEHHALRRWAWLQLLGEGIRALCLAGRWTDAVAHARTYRGIGLHLMEGRQALIVALCLNNDARTARTALAGSTLTQPWERQVAACLKVLCATAYRTPDDHHVRTMIERYLSGDPGPGYATYRAHLGLTVATLARPTDPNAADEVLAHVTDEAVSAADGYAARDVLKHLDLHDSVTPSRRQHDALSRIVTTSGLTPHNHPEHLQRDLRRHAQSAADSVCTALATGAAKVERSPQPAVEISGGTYP